MFQKDGLYSQMNHCPLKKSSILKKEEHDSQEGIYQNEKMTIVFLLIVQR